MGILANLAVKIGADFTDFDKSLKKKMATTSTASGATVKASGSGSGLGGLALGKAGAIAGMTAGVVSTFLNNGIKAFKSIVDQSRIMGIVKDILQGTIGNMMSALFFVMYTGFAALKPLVSPIGNIVTDLSANLGPKLDIIGTHLSNVVTNLVEKIGTLFLSNSTTISTAIGLVVESLGLYTTGLMEYWTNIITKIGDVGSSISGTVTKLETWLTDWWDNKFQVFITSATEFVVAEIGLLKTVMGSVGGYLLDALSIWGGIGVILTNVLTSLTNGLSFLLNKIGLGFGGQRPIMSAIDKGIWVVAKNTTPKSEKEKQEEAIGKLLLNNPELAEKVRVLGQAGFDKSTIIDSIWDSYMKAYNDWQTANMKRRIEAAGGTSSGTTNRGISNDYWGDTFTDLLTGGYMNG